MAALKPGPGFDALCAVLRQYLRGQLTTSAAGQVGMALGVVLSEAMDEGELRALKPRCRDRLMEGFDAAF